MLGPGLLLMRSPARNAASVITTPRRQRDDSDSVMVYGIITGHISDASMTAAGCDLHHSC